MHKELENQNMARILPVWAQKTQYQEYGRQIEFYSTSNITGVLGQSCNLDFVYFLIT